MAFKNGEKLGESMGGSPNALKVDSFPQNMILEYWL
jgi:hypothetical protein